MSIALDAMGGDFAPKEIVLGALEAAPLISGKIFLVGRRDAIQPFLPAHLPHNISLIEAEEVVEMDEKPTEAYRRKKQSSLGIATQMVHNGQAKAMVSAGNTGAATTFSLMTWKRIAGVPRPAIASEFPTLHGGCVMLDTGASPDGAPEDTVGLGIMGRAYAEKVLGRNNPTVQLLNIGEEEGKGNAWAKAAFDELKKFDWFLGNVEGKDVYTKPCDVVVCDAFVGNIFLKASEGIGEMISTILRQSVPSNPLLQAAFLPMKMALKPLRKTMDYAEYGGSPLLGVNGLCLICHGRSSAKAIKSALLKAQRMIDSDLVGVIRQSLHEFGLDKEKGPRQEAEAP